jgi:hypothetical protein
MRLSQPDASDDEIDRQVSSHMARQELLSRQRPPLVWAVVDEAVLRRPIATTAVMRGQLRHLIHAAHQPGVRIQVLLSQAGSCVAAATEGFTILRFSNFDLPDVACVEQPGGETYIGERREVNHYSLVMDNLCVQAEPIGSTAWHLRRILNDL